MAARRKLVSIAEGGGPPLAMQDAKCILAVMQRDSERIESLYRSLPYDD